MSFSSQGGDATGRARTARKTANEESLTVLMAAFSDVHANLHALQAVLADMRGQSADKVVCLGDLVGYGAFPNEVIEAVRAAFRRVEYDVEAAARAIEGAELPREFADDLREGASTGAHAAGRT